MTALTGADDDLFARTGEVPAVGSQEDAKRRGLRHRITSGELDLRNTWQIVVGAILLPLGVAGILLGWAGAANGRVDQQQIPYLISGGLLGLAAVIVGGFFFWAHWLYRIYDQADLHHQEAMRQQSEMIQALMDTVARQSSVLAAGGSSNGPTTRFVATQSGTNFHSPDCPIIANRASSLRSVSPDESPGLRPCRVCEPLGALP